jgi:Cytochrome P460
MKATSKDLHFIKMHRKIKMHRNLLLLICLPAVGSFSGAAAQNELSFDGFKLVDKTGNIHKPIDYRDRLQLMGTYMVLDPKGNQMHNTYASRGAAEYYQRNGKFADGTVRLKEVDGTGLTTGNANWAADTKVWFVLIKDAKGRFPGNPLWGDGWGWALFKSDVPDKQVASDFKKDCLGCHTPAKASEWIYVQGYPVLHSR